MKRKTGWLLLLPFTWFLLLLILFLAEQGAADSAIRSMGDALWYSVVTLSTVGYGDSYPVTRLGKMIGAVFIVFSTGFLAAVLGFVLSVINGRFLPRLQLWMQRKKPWKVFVYSGDRAVFLAQPLSCDGSTVVCLGEKKDWPGVRAVFFNGELSEFMESLHTGSTELFCLGDDEAANYAAAQRFASGQVQVYAAVEYVPDKLPENVVLFYEPEACARDYWTRHPLKNGEHTVLLAGCGVYGSALLELGLPAGVSAPESSVCWHIFGGREWKTLHPELFENAELAGFGGDGDSIVFHEEAWAADAELLKHADRIILCHDEEKLSLTQLNMLRRFIPTEAEVHIRLSAGIDGERCFGTREQLWNAESVVGQQLEQRAMALHRIYCSGVGPSAPDWRNLSDFQRRSNAAAALHIPAKLRFLGEDPETVTEESCRRAAAVFRGLSPAQRELCRKMEHTRWCRFHLMYNWRRAEERDNRRRLHPLLRPFEELPLQEQEKDDYPWELLDKLAF